MCTINLESVRRSLGLPFPIAKQTVTQFSELSGLAAIKSLNPEELTSFMAKLLKLEINQTHATFPYDISSFSELIQAIFSLLIQILGLKSVQFVTEVMIGTLYLVSQSKEQKIIKYDEFLIERINFQLENFHNSRKIFRYQTLLMFIVINNNLQTLQ